MLRKLIEILKTNTDLSSLLLRELLKITDLSPHIRSTFQTDNPTSMLNHVTPSELIKSQQVLLSLIPNRKEMIIVFAI